MSPWYAVGDLMAKLKLVQRSYKLVTDLRFGFNRFASSFESHNPSNHFRPREFQGAPFCQSYNLVGNSVNASRSFTKTNSVWKPQRTNQDKEKMKNYIFLGGIVLAVLFCFYMSYTMEYHQDYVDLDFEEEKK